MKHFRNYIVTVNQNASKKCGRRHKHAPNISIGNLSKRVEISCNEILKLLNKQIRIALQTA